MTSLARINRVLIAAIVFSAASVASSCNRAAESESYWQRYKGGGLFMTDAPSLSPDGHFLAFASACTGHGDIYKIMSGSESPIRLTSSPDFESSPAFTPDGKRIIFVRERGNCRTIWIMDADGKNQIQLTHGTESDDIVSLSRNGRYLIFRRITLPLFGLGSSTNSYLLSLHEETPKPVAVGEVAVFAPDSESVLFTRGGQLWSLQLGDAGAEPRHVAAEGLAPIGVSKDGRYCFAYKNRGAQEWPNANIIAFDRQRERELELGVGHSVMLFGPNSDCLLFQKHDLEKADSNGAFVTSVDDMKPTRVEWPAGYTVYPRLCWRQNVALICSMRIGLPEYEVMSMDLTDFEITTIATVTCSEVRFETDGLYVPRRE